MADRPNHLQGYPMPQTNMMNLAQQQQQSSMAYQQQQQSMNAAQQIPGVTNPEHQRMWQQIQDRHRAMGGADGIGQQHLNPQQMSELLRSQAALHAQNQHQQHQQPPQLQQAQQFANLGGMAQMNNPLAGQNSLLAMQRQQGMQNGGVGGLSNMQMTPQMAQLLAQQQQQQQQRNNVTNPAMIQMNRQLGLLNRAQKQQPQNGPANFGMPGSSFSGQQNLGQLPLQAAMFPPKQDDGRMPNPQGQQQFQQHPGVPNASVQTRQFPNDPIQQSVRANDGRHLSLDEIRFKAQQLKGSIQVERQRLEQFPKNGPPDMLLAVKRKEAEIQRQELLFTRLVEYLTVATNQQGGPQLQQPAPPNSTDGQGGGGLNSMGFPNAIQQQQAGQHQLQSNQNWTSQMNNVGLPNQFPGNGLPGNQALLNNASQNGAVQVPRPQVNSPFHPNLVQSQQQQAPVPRSNPTPQQQQQMLQAFLQQQNNAHSSPPSSGSAPIAGQGSLAHQGPTLDSQEGHQRPNGLSFPPLGRERFQQLLQEWWKRNGISPNAQMLTIGNRDIDIHQLHTEVLQYGGVVNVRRHDLWNVIAAKMGWTPATLSEAGRTQDQIAEQLKAVYAQLLETFEQNYMAAAMKQSLTAPQQQATDHQGASDQRSTAANQLSRQQLNQAQMVHMMKLANIPVEQLRASGYPENLVQNIEQNRPQLQAALHRLTLSRLQANQNQQQQQQQPSGTVVNGSLPFQNQVQPQPAVHNPSALPPQSGAAVGNALGHPGTSAGASQANGLSAQQRPQPAGHQLTPQNMQMLGMLSNFRRPTMEMTKRALEIVEQQKQNLARDRPLRPEHFKTLSEADKALFPDLFETVCNMINQICIFLHEYLAATGDMNTVNGALRMLDLCDKQRQMVQSTNPIYILDIPTLQGLSKTCTDLKTRVGIIVQRLRQSAAQAEQNHAQPPMTQQSDPVLPPPAPVQQGHSPQNIAPPSASGTPRPPTVQPQPPHVVQQGLRPPPGRTPQLPPARPPSVAQSKRAQTAISSNATEKVSSPSASTPLPSNATSNHLQTSPVTPKSPKNKTPAKPRQQRQRRASVKQQSTASAATTTPSTSTGTGGQVAATTPSATAPAASPAQASTSPKGTSLKRPREEDSSDQAGPSVPSDEAGGETPSKRIKNDWESVADAEPSKRQVEAENIKTTDDAAKFYSDMTQLLAMSNNAELPPEVHDTLTQLVKTVGNGLDIPDAGRNSSVSGLAAADNSSSTAGDGDDFLRFLDFTAFQQDDDKADTPDLVPASSTNPSPESLAGSEVDHPPVPSSSGTAGDRTRIVDISESETKLDFLDSGSDPLRLGVWGEIDGGESGYFNSSDMWKWDALPSSSGDNSWAIST